MHSKVRKPGMRFFTWLRHSLCSVSFFSVVDCKIEWKVNGNLKLIFQMADHQGMTALHLSCLYGRRTIVKLLLEAGAKIRCKDKDMTTPLHLACAEGSIEVQQD